jgi:hypothetical protein
MQALHVYLSYVFLDKHLATWRHFCMASQICTAAILLIKTASQTNTD